MSPLKHGVISHLNFFITLISLSSLLLSTHAIARPEFADELGVSGQCTLCHNSPDGGRDTLKDAARQAFDTEGVRPGLENYLKSLQPNAKPVILPIDKEWNLHIGQTLSIPLTIKDDKSQGHTMELVLNKPALIRNTHSFSTFSVIKGQPTTKFNWRPSTKQKPVNTKYTLGFRSFEKTSSNAKQFSNTVNTSVYLWPARVVSNKHVVEQHLLNSASWKANQLTLNGKIIFKQSATAAAKAAALRNLRLSLKSFTNKIINTSVKLTPNRLGIWKVIIPLNSRQVPCIAKTEFERLIAARSVQNKPATCKK